MPDQSASAANSPANLATRTIAANVSTPCTSGRLDFGYLCLAHGPSACELQTSGVVGGPPAHPVAVGGSVGEELPPADGHGRPSDGVAIGQHQLQVRDGRAGLTEHDPERVTRPRAGDLVDFGLPAVRPCDARRACSGAADSGEAGAPRANVDERMPLLAVDSAKADLGCDWARPSGLAWLNPADGLDAGNSTGEGDRVRKFA